jgi:hypothetical protein
MQNLWFKRVVPTTLVAVSLFGGLLNRQARATPTKEDAPKTYVENYTVRWGNSLWRIARRQCGNPLLYTTIADDNNIDAAHGYIIHPNQTLKISCSLTAPAVAAMKAAEVGTSGGFVDHRVPLKQVRVAAAAVAVITAIQRAKIATNAGKTTAPSPPIHTASPSKKIYRRAWWFEAMASLTGLGTLWYFRRSVMGLCITLFSGCKRLLSRRPRRTWFDYPPTVSVIPTSTSAPTPPPLPLPVPLHSERQVGPLQIDPYEDRPWFSSSFLHSFSNFPSDRARAGLPPELDQFPDPAVYAFAEHGEVSSTVH